MCRLRIIPETLAHTKKKIIDKREKKEIKASYNIVNPGCSFYLENGYCAASHWMLKYELKIALI